MGRPPRSKLVHGFDRWVDNPHALSGWRWIYFDDLLNVEDDNENTRG
jgi:hypothetical protein